MNAANKEPCTSTGASQKKNTNSIAIVNKRILKILTLITFRHMLTMWEAHIQ